jgi:hypothetical protein
MKHVKLFESFDTMISPEELETQMTPEEYGAEIDKAIQMGHVEGAKHVKSLKTLNLYQSSSKENRRMPMKYAAHMKRYHNHMDSFTPDQKIEIRKALIPGYKTPEEEEAERKANHAASLQKSKDYWAGQEREREERNAPIRSKRSAVLDRFAAGEITKEEALAALEKYRLID